MVDAPTATVTGHDRNHGRAFHFWVFQLLFMVGFLFHTTEEWDAPPEAFITIAMIAGFLAFTSQHRWREITFLAFVVLLAARNIEKFPGLANHSNVILFICLFLIPLQVRRIQGAGHDGPAKRRAVERTEETIATLRWVIALMYFFAGFHKLNEDFFNPEVTCAFDKMEDYLRVASVSVADLPAILQKLVPAGVVAMELVPAAFFLFRPTQKLGIAMLLLVHGLLAPVGFADFSSLAMSLLWLFVPVDAMPKMPGRRFFIVLAASFLIMQLVLATWRIPIGDQVFGDLEGLVLIAGFAPVWFLYFRARVPGPAMRWPGRWAHRAFLAFMVFFAMNNYFGLRTAGTLSMFSNLVTEGPRSNHFLLGGNPLKVFGFQEDVVHINRVDRRVRGRFRDHLLADHAAVRVEFARILERLRRRRYRRLYLDVTYNGQRYVTRDLLNDPQFDFSVPWWQTKLLKFRVIQPQRPQQCAW